MSSYIEQPGPNTLERQHAHRNPTPESIEKLRMIRQATYSLATLLDRLLPPSRERSTAQTKLDEARMWACNAATMDGEIREPIW